MGAPSIHGWQDSTNGMHRMHIHLNSAKSGLNEIIGLVRMMHNVSLPCSATHKGPMPRAHSSLTSAVDSVLVWVQGGLDGGCLWRPSKREKAERTYSSLRRCE